MEGVPNKNVRGNPKQTSNSKQPPPKLTNFFKKATAPVPVAEPEVQAEQVQAQTAQVSSHMQESRVSSNQVRSIKQISL
jgi:hypothetical protein